MSGNPPPSVALDAGRLAGLLADDDRRRVFAAIELGGTTLDAAATLAGLPVPARRQGIVDRWPAPDSSCRANEGGLYVVGAAFQVAAREALSRPSSDEHGDRSGEVRRVFDAFVRDGRLTQIPTSRQKRLVLLDWLAQDFDPGARYSEPMVNLILGKRHRRHCRAAALSRRRRLSRSGGR